jgi:hypothetical protein
MLEIDILTCLNKCLFQFALIGHHTCPLVPGLKIIFCIFMI